MKSFTINNIRKLTSALFAGTTFDTFCVTEAFFSTLFDTKIDGHKNTGYEAGEQASEQEPGVICWGQIRPLCYEIVKGERLPQKFRIVLMTPPDKVPGFLSKHGISMNPSDVNALFMNIRYENGVLSCISAISLKTFTLDKSLETAWDNSCGSFLSRFE